MPFAFISSQINKMDSKLRPDNPESLIRRLADMKHVVNLDSVLHSSYYCADIWDRLLCANGCQFFCFAGWILTTFREDTRGIHTIAIYYLTE